MAARTPDAESIAATLPNYKGHLDMVKGNTGAMQNVIKEI